MIKCVMVLAISIFFFVSAFKVKQIYKKQKLEVENYKQTYATIDRAIFSDKGNVKYYISFFENGNNITAQTDHYTSETKSLNPGDEVKIGYYFTKRGAPRAVILDERVIPVSNSVPAFYKFLTIIGILLFLTALFMFIKINFI